MFTQPCFIIKNTPELIEKLKSLGYEYCPQYDNSCDSLHTRINWNPHFVEEHYVDLDSDKPLDGIDCGTNESLFLAIASLRDDTDINQWFVHKSGAHWWLCSDFDSFKEDFESSNEDDELKAEDYHKATVKELIEFFKDK